MGEKALLRRVSPPNSRSGRQRPVPAVAVLLITGLPVHRFEQYLSLRDQAGSGKKESWKMHMQKLPAPTSPRALAAHCTIFLNTIFYSRHAWHHLIHSLISITR